MILAVDEVRLFHKTLELHGYLLPNDVFVLFSQMSLSETPNEVLEQILLRIPQKKIPALTLVSAQFNEVISSSVKLMESFKLVWTEENESMDMTSVRKYRGVELDNDRISSKFVDFMRHHSKTVNNLKLKIYNDYTEDGEIVKLQEILNLVADNLEILTLDGAPHQQTNLNSIKFAKLKTLILRSDQLLSLLDLFRTARLQSFSLLNCWTRIDDNFEILAKFFESQPHLKSLSINGPLIREEIMSRAAFKLKELFYDPFYKSGWSSFLEPFLLEQMKTLTKLSLFGLLISGELIKSFLASQVVSLRIERCKFLWIESLGTTNTHVKNLCIGNVGEQDNAKLYKFLECCPNVESIEFYSLELNLMTNLLLAYKMPSLERLKLGDGVDTCILPYKSLKYLEIGRLLVDGDDVSSAEQVIQLVLANHNLKAIEVSSGFLDEETFQNAIRLADIEDKIYYSSS